MYRIDIGLKNSEYMFINAFIKFKTNTLKRVLTFYNNNPKGQIITSPL